MSPSIPSARNALGLIQVVTGFTQVVARLVSIVDTTEKAKIGRGDDVPSRACFRQDGGDIAGF